MPWYKITPTSEQERRDVESAFEMAFGSAASKDFRAVGSAAMYATSLKHSIRNAESLYFSPDSSIFFSAQLAAFGATDCERPNRNEIAPQLGQGNFDKDLFAE